MLNLKKVGIITMNSVLLFEDDKNHLEILQSVLNSKLGLSVTPVKSYTELKNRIDEKLKKGQWFDYVMLDVDLSLAGETMSGIDIYYRICKEYPNEIYIIYTSRPLDSLRRDFNRLSLENVELLVLENISDSSNLLHLKNQIKNELMSKFIYTKRNTAFLVSGRNSKKNRIISNILRKCFGLKIINWNMAIKFASAKIPDPKNYIFDIVLAGIENSYLTIVLFTDDEKVELRNEFWNKEEKRNPTKSVIGSQSRKNVYIEAGYALGKRPNRTLFIEWPDDPANFLSASDFEGIYVLRYDDTPTSRYNLKERLLNVRADLKLASKWKTLKV